MVREATGWMYLRSSTRYEPGDVAVIKPKNLAEEVDAFLEQMHWSDIANRPIKIVPASEGKRLLSRRRR